MPTKTIDEPTSMAAIPAGLGFTTALALSENEQLEVEILDAKPSLIRALKKTIGAKLTDEEFLLFCAWCASKRIDPISQAYVFKSSNESAPAMGLRIDGMRALAMRTGDYLSREVSEIVEKDRDGKEVVIGARCTIVRKGMEKPVVEEAYFEEYRRKGIGWDQFPGTMIRKVAESKALRAAFPDALSGVYEPAEME